MRITHEREISSMRMVMMSSRMKRGQTIIITKVPIANSIITITIIITIVKIMVMKILILSQVRSSRLGIIDGITAAITMSPLFNLIIIILSKLLEILKNNTSSLRIIRPL